MRNAITVEYKRSNSSGACYVVCKCGTSANVMDMTLAWISALRNKRMRKHLLRKLDVLKA